MKVKEVKAAENEGHRYRFMCPGCNRSHEISDSWEFNGDFDNPTFKPSVLGTGKWPNEEGEWEDWRCHSFIENGEIRFLNDSTHSLAGKTVELPEID